MIFLIDCVEKLKTCLFMVGEIGGNDYNYPFFQGKSSNVVRDLVPKVVKRIKDAVTVCFISKQKNSSKFSLQNCLP